MDEAALQDLIDRNALFVVNHSAGKDSQAMQIQLERRIPRPQLLVVHADLGDVEWAGCKEHIRSTIGDLPLIVCRNERKTFLEMVAHRGMFPSPQQRQCTSDLKRNPITREIRRYLKDHPEYGGLVVNCMGLRAEESPGRAKAVPFRRHEGNSVAGREWYDWLPIHNMLIDEVWKTIADAGQEPHWAYAKGMKRLSCKICIMSSDEDLRTAAILDPVNFKRYVEMERSTGRTIMMPRGGVPMTLEQITGLNADALLLDAGLDPNEVMAGFIVATGTIVSPAGPIREFAHAP